MTKVSCYFFSELTSYVSAKAIIEDKILIKLVAVLSAPVSSSFPPGAAADAFVKQQLDASSHRCGKYVGLQCSSH
jgi:hypothetical protein